MNEFHETLWIGLDVGSTTVKLAVVDPVSGELLHSRYRRHNAHQSMLVREFLEEAHALHPTAAFRLAVCGSGGSPFAETLGGFFVQEVVANSLAVRKLHPATRVAIELGGQDAKVVFFETDPVTGRLLATDMRMNGVCAGGTGAFLDQVGELLRLPMDEFDGAAARGTVVHEISGRCGVFAKTDIQPLLNQGADRADIALSAFHAIAKQTIGGLAQGLEIRAPVLFEGGPLAHCPTLVRVFRERLGLGEEQGVLPEHSDILVAWGAALSAGSLFSEEPSRYKGVFALDAPVPTEDDEAKTAFEGTPYFHDQAEIGAFRRRHATDATLPPMPPPGTVRKAWLGVDGGSTTTKLVLLSDRGEVLHSFYANNAGDPLRILREALVELRELHRRAGVELEILGAGTTGYGEKLFAKALKADHHTVETVAHARAAREIRPDVSFILDIGGQDMKAISVRDGVVTGIVLNEACSSGCGSFVETYARSLGVEPGDIADEAFASKSPSKLGSRCTVFMNSSIITEQRDGKTRGDILAGVCRSIVENVFTKVVRVRNLETLGKTVVVQGGTFRNDAVLRAFEQYLDLEAVRPSRPGEMGAIGIALLTREAVAARRQGDPAWRPSFIGLDALDDLSWDMVSGKTCPFCSNHCARTVVTFSDGSSHVTGNRCERGEVLGAPNDRETRERIADIRRRMDAVPDLMERQNAQLFSTPSLEGVTFSRGMRVGIPRVLEFWSSLPFWKSFFSTLGCEPVVSRPNDHALFEEGLHSVPSDTVCFPAKIVHGAVLDLARKKVDRIFLPVMVSLPSEHKGFRATAVCPVVQGYPLVVRNGDKPQENFGIPLDQPVFHWSTTRLRRSQCVSWFSQNWGIPAREVGRAVDQAEKVLDEFRLDLERQGGEVLREVREGKGFAVVLAGRPYHADPLVNHRVSAQFSRMGIPVLTLESLPGVHDVDLPQLTRLETLNSYHCRLMAGAVLVARDPCLEMVQIVSFGCGHDASLTDEVARILREKGGKDLLNLKLDEGDVPGPLAIRIESFVETVRARRDFGKAPVAEESGFAPVGFFKEDKFRRKVLIPNLSRGFAVLAASIFQNQGFDTEALRVADADAVALGKKYVHNDICFPAQINIGEALRWFQEHPGFPQEKIALGLAKNCENCRAGQYAALARKALDEAGLDRVPIVTTGRDTKGAHPGFKTNLDFRLKMLWGMSILDGLEAMLRAVRPYETSPGASDAVFDRWMPEIMEAVAEAPRKGLHLLEEAVEAFNGIPADRSTRKPRVGILGEILMKYHPTANGRLEEYVERAGLEVVRPGMIDFFRREELIRMNKVHRGLVDHRLRNALIGGVTAALYARAVNAVGHRMEKFRWHEPHPSCYEMVHLVEDMMDPSYVTGEGWLIPAEVMALAEEGVNSFVIVQPFACLTNHISGRGMTKALKERLPHIQILSLDYDPDTSFANIENRLQMLVLNARDLEARNAKPDREPSHSRH